jgi:hypothetical protein
LFEKALIAGWGGMGFNAHMRNPAHPDRAAAAPMLSFAAPGLPTRECVRRRIRPVAMGGELEHLRELNLLDEPRFTLELAGLPADGSRLDLRNCSSLPGGSTEAHVSSPVGWISRVSRRLAAPPAALCAALPLRRDREPHGAGRHRPRRHAFRQSPRVT